MSNPETEQEWVEAALEVVQAARDAAKAGDKKAMRKAADDCLDFVSNRTLACPKQAVSTVAAAQVELSQLLVKDDIGSIKSRTAQFEAFLQDLDHLSEKAERAADLISFKSASAIVSNLSTIVASLETVQSQLEGNNPDKAQQSIIEIIEQLQLIQEKFENLRNPEK